MSRTLFSILALLSIPALAAEERSPNIAPVMSDELEHPGNPDLKAPNLGPQFAEAPVYGPLMTGEQGPEGEAGKAGATGTTEIASLDSWTGNLGEWAMAKSISASKTEKNWTAVTDGDGIFYNGNNGGKTTNLISKATFGDVKAVIEFMIPAKSNSGIYFQERYELQILDSFGKSDDEFGVHDMGAIYERWDKSKPKGENGFEGTVASSNASNAPGEWQTYEITFRAPRFDSEGKKTENAKFVSVKLNGVEIHKNVEVTGPTRGGKEGPEAASAAINIQGNHGPVAFRKLEFTPISLD